MVHNNELFVRQRGQGSPKIEEIYTNKLSEKSQKWARRNIIAQNLKAMSL